MIDVFILPEKAEYMAHKTILKHIFGLYAKIRNNNAD